jgi:small multidrug resistance pump
VITVDRAVSGTALVLSHSGARNLSERSTSCSSGAVAHVVLVEVLTVPWLFLVGAILTEVAATTALKLSEGFTRLAPSIVVVVGYVTAFGMLSQALTRGMGVGVAYGVWAAAGMALVTIIGAVFLGENMTWVQVGGIAIIIAGVLTLELGAHHPGAQQ